jgi:hypothetical protein
MAAVLPGDVGGPHTYPTTYIQDFVSILYMAERQELVGRFKPAIVFCNTNSSLHVEKLRAQLSIIFGSHSTLPHAHLSEASQQSAFAEECQNFQLLLRLKDFGCHPTLAI